MAPLSDRAIGFPRCRGKALGDGSCSWARGRVGFIDTRVACVGALLVSGLAQAAPSQGKYDLPEPYLAWEKAYLEAYPALQDLMDSMVANSAARLKDPDQDILHNRVCAALSYKMAVDQKMPDEVRKLAPATDILHNIAKDDKAANLTDPAVFARVSDVVARLKKAGKFTKSPKFFTDESILKDKVGGNLALVHHLTGAVAIGDILRKSGKFSDQEIAEVQTAVMAHSTGYWYFRDSVDAAAKRPGAWESVFPQPESEMDKFAHDADLISQPSGGSARLGAIATKPWADRARLSPLIGGDPMSHDADRQSRSEAPRPPRRPVIRASVVDTLAMVAEVVAPTLGKGVIVRRPRVVAMAESLGLDDRAVRRMQRLRAAYGTGPLRLAIPGRRQIVLLAPDDVRTVLEGAPEPFSPASGEKRAALAHMEPQVSLISEGGERADRRRFNERMLEPACPVHRLADSFLRVIDEEAETLLSQVGAALSWDAFAVAWMRMVRRIVLGDGARDDHALTDMLARLRASANWAFLHPGRPRLRRRYHARLQAHLDRAEPGSLAGLAAELPTTPETAPSDQVTQYLFAFDPGGMATLRALALLAAHPGEASRAREEIAADRAGRRTLPRLRAAVLESLRLWPTTPAILRETTRDVPWGDGVIPANTGILIFAPFFHRDDETQPYAHRFTPDLWLGGEPGGGAMLVPFSGGPAICPAFRLMPMVGSAMIAAILGRRSVTLADPARLDPSERLPGTLDPYTLRFRLAPPAG